LGFWLADVARLGFRFLGIAFKGVGGPENAPRRIFLSRCWVSSPLCWSSLVGADMADSPDSAEDHGAEFHMHMGYCIAEWAAVEEELFRICWQCLGSQVQQAAVVYYRSPSLDTRLTLVDELVESVMPRPQRKSGGHPHAGLKKWTAIRNELIELKPIRNRLAHHPVTPWDIEVVGLDSGPVSVAWHEIHTGYWEQLRPHTKPYKPLKVDDLTDHRKEVQALTAKLQHFRAVTLLAHVPLPPSPTGSAP
jgi:hypothetical protein